VSGCHNPNGASDQSGFYLCIVVSMKAVIVPGLELVTLYPGNVMDILRKAFIVGIHIFEITDRLGPKCHLT